MKHKNFKNILISITAISCITGASLGLASTQAQATLNNKNQQQMYSQDNHAKQPYCVDNLSVKRLKNKKYLRNRHNIRIKNWRQRHSYAKQFQLGLNNKDISKQQAIIITKAALIMQNHSDYTIGSIQTIAKKNQPIIYKIHIMNAHNKLASIVRLNSATGHIKPWKQHKK